MKDRLTAGFISGFIAGIAMNIVDWAGYLLGFHSERLLDWGGVVVYGTLPYGAYQIIFAQLVQLGFAGFLGIVFSSLLLRLTSENSMLKGIIYGIIIWLSIYAVSVAIHLPFMERHFFNAAVSHAVSSVVYGLVLAEVLNYLDYMAAGSVRKS